MLGMRQTLGSETNLCQKKGSGFEFYETPDPLKIVGRSHSTSCHIRLLDGKHDQKDTTTWQNTRQEGKTQGEDAERKADTSVPLS